MNGNATETAYNFSLARLLVSFSESTRIAETDSIREPGYETENLEELVAELTHKLALEPTMHARH